MYKIECQAVWNNESRIMRPWPFGRVTNLLADCKYYQNTIWDLAKTGPCTVVLGDSSEQKTIRFDSMKLFIVCSPLLEPICITIWLR